MEKNTNEYQYIFHKFDKEKNVLTPVVRDIREEYLKYCINGIISITKEDAYSSEEYHA